ncbi:hypothetical protein EST38_g9917 [Candolleomyces aberdarensis]|uniref:TLC domain-containing protein n=1 Tax=Candolleomyces aberdarensis TaxID=2316362 RepID=A0A4Q2D8Q9_9AGAR|nr:hypothetical protein EST38_g9917 [Candolleomyces aberdarensis]
MAPGNTHPRKRPAPFTDQIEKDPSHHLAGPFLPQTPLGSLAPSRTGSPVSSGFLVPSRRVPPWWLQWATNPYTALKLLITPVVLYLNWKYVTPYVAPGLPNPFAPIFLLSGYIPTSKPEDPRYAKSYFDLVFLAYYIVFFSFIREYLATTVSRPLARYFGLRKEAKIDRFAEQFYALVYFSCFGAWGYFIVLVLGLEKPRKDYKELVAHHFVTLWLVGWSYLLNLTIIGSAVYMSMDIPDAFLAASKLLNYIQWERAKIVTFVTFIGVWTYFRHYLNLKMLWSVWYENVLVPEFSKQWNWSEGVYIIWWLPPAAFASILALQVLNLFWYWLMWRILIRAIVTRVADDDRSDDEDEDEPTANGKQD